MGACTRTGDIMGHGRGSRSPERRRCCGFDSHCWKWLGAPEATTQPFAREPFALPGLYADDHALTVIDDYHHEAPFCRPTGGHVRVDNRGHCRPFLRRREWGHDFGAAVVVGRCESSTATTVLPSGITLVIVSAGYPAASYALAYAFTSTCAPDPAFGNDGVERLTFGGQTVSVKGVVPSPQGGRSSWAALTPSARRLAGGW